MQKIKMSRGTLLTFEEGCNKYLENCRQRNSARFVPRISQNNKIILNKKPI